LTVDPASPDVGGDASGRSLGLGLDDLSSGEPALLLLTGWCSSRARWARAAPLLGARWRVVNFEWRGHGESAPAHGDFGTAEMLQDALAVIDACELDQLIPCAASHAGWVAIELRRELGHRVPALVLLDWIVTEPEAEFVELIGRLQSERDWRRARDTLLQTWRGSVPRPEIDDALAVMRKHSARMWRRAGREIASSYTRYGSPVQALAELDSPPRVLHLYGQPHSPDYLAAQRRFAGEHDWFRVKRLQVSSHFSMLEAPNDVAMAIDAVAAEVTERAR